MGRNTEKYVYVTMRFERESEVYKALLDDGQRTGEELSRLGPIRLSDFYEGRSGSTSQTTPPIVPISSSSTARKNALQAAHVWGKD